MSHSRSKKLLLIVPSIRGGGAEKVAVFLAQHLVNSPFQPIMVNFRTPDETLMSHFPLISLNIKGRTFFQIPQIFIGLARIIQQEKPEIILSFLTHCNLLVTLAAIFYRSRVIVSEHGLLSGQLKLEHVLVSGVKSVFVRILYRFVSAIVVVSDGLKADLVKKYGLPPNRIVVIYNPVDFTETLHMSREPAPVSPFKENLPVVVTVGRLSPEKGHQYLFGAFRIIRRSYNCKLVVIGDGPLRGSLYNLVQQLGISNDVTFLGYVNNPTKFVANSKVFVLPSLHEGFGLVLVEAMICGVPVVATACSGGTSEIIQDKVNGLLVPPANEIEIAKAIRLILSDNVFAERLAENGRKRAKDFDTTPILRRYKQLFENVLNSRF
ncbi:MAG: glycosyltransferase [Candidatus Bathyarchaeia archaeon]|jgi:glycosyltransferase involved in cell wall biosynthesis